MNSDADPKPDGSDVSNAGDAEPPPDTRDVPGAGDAEAKLATSETALTPAVERPPVPPASEQPEDKQAPAWTEERVASERGKLDVAIALLVVLIAGAVALFPATNSELWRHLATGRLVAARAFTFGTDPYTVTTEGVRWVDHDWLFDLKIYELANVFGGPEAPAGGAALVVVKALMIAFLAWVLMSIRRLEQGYWAPAAAALLAVLAMAPELQLGPSIVSYLFLAITVYLLTRPEPEEPPSGWLARGLSSTPLCLFVLFAMWVNMDRWFVLGPLTVALYWLGVGVQSVVAPIQSGPDAAGPRAHRSLLLSFFAGLVGCLLNPYHLFAFALPREVAFYVSASPLKQDPYFARMLYSPLQAEFITNPALGRNVLAWAFPVLALLTALSFALNRAGTRWWRLVLWVSFLVPAVLMAAAVPFFAVISAPILALNLQDVAARVATGAGTSREERLRSLGGRFATALACMVVLAVCLADLPHVRPTGQHLGWRVLADTSMVRGAWKVDELRRQGVLTKGGFNFTPAFADYVDWFAPGSRSFLDERVTLFPADVQQDYELVRRALMTRPTEAGRPARADAAALERIFTAKARPLDHLVVCASPGPREDIDETMAVLFHLWPDPERWTMLSLDGHVAIFAYHDPQQPAQARPFARARYNPALLAFLPEGAAEPEVRCGGAEPRPAGTDEAALLRGYFEAMQDNHKNRYQRARRLTLNMERFLLDETLLMGTLFAVPGPAGCLVPQARAVAIQHLLAHPPNSPYYLQRVPPVLVPGAAILSIRAARQGVAAAPERADAYLALAAALFTLRDTQRVLLPSAPLLDEIRRVQLITALSRAVQLKPTPAAHRLLANLYAEMAVNNRRTHVDLLVYHIRRALELEAEAGPSDLESAATFEKNLKLQQAELQKFEEGLKRQRTTFDLDSAGKDLGSKLQIAQALGLAEVALDLILTNQKEVGADPQRFQRPLVMLLLKNGQLDAVRKAGGPSGNDPLKAIRDPFLNLLIAAADGDMAEADNYLAEMVLGAQQEESRALLLNARDLAFQGNLAALPNLQQLVALSGGQADAQTIRAMLALEQGDNKLAAELFRKVIGLTLPVDLVQGQLACLAAHDGVSLLTYMAPPRRLNRFSFDYLPLANYYHLLLQSARHNAAAKD